MIPEDEKQTHAACQCLEGMLSDYLDGELEAALCAEIEKHLPGCENCRVVVDTLKKTVELYHSISQSESLPDEVRERLYKRLMIEDLINKTSC